MPNPTALELRLLKLQKATNNWPKESCPLTSKVKLYETFLRKEIGEAGLAHEKRLEPILKPHNTIETRRGFYLVKKTSTA